MAEVFNNDAFTILNANMAIGATTLVVQSNNQFNVGGTFRIRIDDEIMTVTGVAGTTWTVTRASEVCEGVQSASAHTSGAGVYGVLTAGSLATIAAAGGGSVTSVSVATANGVSGSVTTPSTTPTITITLGAITPASVAASGTVTGSNLSGTNTGDQTITLTGDVTGTGGGSFVTTISGHSVTYAKMQQAATATLLGNPTGGTADVREITLGSNLSFVGSVLTISGLGTVSSVGVSGGTTGLTTSGGPVTTSGTITLSGVLIAANGGLGIDSSGFTSGQIPVAQGAGVYAADSRRGLYTGSGVPADVLGFPSDYYIDLGTGIIYLKS